MIYSRNSAASVQVPREIRLAKKNGARIVPYRTDDTPLTSEYEEDLSGIDRVMKKEP